jgi:hypothetical protein
MAARNSPNRQFDVFCSYNREELPFVQTLAARLVREAGLLREKIGDRKLPATQELLGQARST